MPQVSLYRESWSVFKRQFTELLPWILSFSALVALCDFYIVRSQVDMAWTLYPYLQNLDQDALSSYLKKYQEPPVVHVADLCSSLIQGIAAYYFSTLYLKREPILPLRGRPELSFGTFLNWLWQIIKAAACVAGVVVTVFAAGFLVALAARAVAPGLESGVAAVGAVAVMLAILAMTVRFFFVSPLALSYDTKAVQTSWQMTKGHWWRLAWNYLCLGWTIFLISLIAFLAVFGVVFELTSAKSDSVLFVAGLSIVLALTNVASLALTCLYLCVSCRIFVQEQGLPDSRESGSIRKIS